MNCYVSSKIGKLLIMCLLAGMLTGCGGASKENETTVPETVTTQGDAASEESTTEAPEETKEEISEEDDYSLPIYDVEWSDVELGVSKVIAGDAGENVLYLYGDVKREEGEVWNKKTILSCDLDGENQRTVIEWPYTPKTLELSEGETYTEMIFGQMSVDSEGNLIVRYREYYHAYGQDKKMGFRIVKYDREGNELWSTRLPEETNNAHFILVEDQIVCGVRPTGHGPMRVLIYDSDGLLVKEHDTGERLTLQLRYYGEKVYLYADMEYMGDKKLREFDIETGEFGKGYTSDIEYDGTWVASGCGYDVLTMNEEGIWGYNFEENHSIKVLDFELSGLEPSMESVLIPVGEHDFCMYFNHKSSQRFAELTRLPAKAVEGKQRITVAEMGNSYREVLKDMNYQFNYNSDLYQVQVINYKNFAELKQDIVAGEGPDVLLLSEAATNLLCTEIESGAFEDLYPWIDGDEVLSRDKLCSAVLRAGEYEGKLYSLVTSFWLDSMLGKTAIFGSNDGWTLEEMKTISEQYPGSKLFDGRYTLNMWIENSGKLFLDEKTGVVNFDSQAFVDMLELAKHAESIVYTDKNSLNLLKNNELLLVNEMISNYTGLHIRAGRFGEAFTGLGYLRDDGNKSILHPEACVLMSAESDCKEGAWQFIRKFMLDEYQDDVGGYFPVLLTAQQKMAEYQLKWNEQYDRYGNVTMIRYATEEEVEIINAIMHNSVSNLYRDEKLWSELKELMRDKLTPYFAGEKTAKEVAEEMQQWAEARISK